MRLFFCLGLGSVTAARLVGVAALSPPCLPAEDRLSSPNSSGAIEMCICSVIPSVSFFSILRAGEFGTCWFRSAKMLATTSNDDPLSFPVSLTSRPSSSLDEGSIAASSWGSGSPLGLWITARLDIETRHSAAK